MKPRTLEQMQNRSTCYEVGLYVNGRQTETIAFMARRTNSSLIAAVRQNGLMLKALLTEEELDNDYSISKTNGLAFYSGRVAIKYTGKTERECATDALRASHAKP